MHIYSRGSFEDSVLYGTFGWRSLFPTGWWQKPPLVPGRLGLLKEQFRTWQLLPSGWAREGQNLISGVTFHCCHILFVRSSYKSSPRSKEEGDCTGVHHIGVFTISVFSYGWRSTFQNSHINAYPIPHARWHWHSSIEQFFLLPLNLHGPGAVFRVAVWFTRSSRE